MPFNLLCALFFFSLSLALTASRSRSLPCLSLRARCQAQKFRLDLRFAALAAMTTKSVLQRRLCISLPCDETAFRLFFLPHQKVLHFTYCSSTREYRSTELQVDEGDWEGAEKIKASLVAILGPLSEWGEQYHGTSWEQLVQGYGLTGFLIDANSKSGRAVTITSKLRRLVSKAPGKPFLLLTQRMVSISLPRAAQ